MPNTERDKNSDTQVHVAVAVILNNNKQVLIAKRPDHVHQGGYWEFPGGKLETGEAVEQALRREIKEELGLPTGFAPANAVYGWDYVKKHGESSRCGAIASIMTYCADAGSDFILFGPVKFAKCVVPSIAMVSGINAYYRKRILRKPISDQTPFKKIF